jgi:hypothetical protein
MQVKNGKGIGKNADEEYHVIQFESLAEIAKFIEAMPILDSKHIRRFLDENEPRLDMRREVTTPSGEKLTVNVGFGGEFFRPFFGL